MPGCLTLLGDPPPQTRPWRCAGPDRRIGRRRFFVVPTSAAGYRVAHRTTAGPRNAGLARADPTDRRGPRPAGRRGGEPGLRRRPARGGGDRPRPVPQGARLLGPEGPAVHRPGLRPEVLEEPQGVRRVRGDVPG